MMNKKIKKLNAILTAPIIGMNLNVQEPIQLVSLSDMIQPTMSQIREEIKRDKLKMISQQFDYVETELSRMRNVTVDYNNLLVKSNLVTSEVQALLEGTALYECSEYYIEAEELTGVNAFILISLTALESGWGESRLAKLKNNLSGFMAYNVESFESAYHFKSKRESIIKTAELLKNSYLTEGQWCYNGLALKDVNVKYCLLNDGSPDYNWSKQIKTISEGLLKKLNKHHEEREVLLISTL